MSQQYLVLGELRDARSQDPVEGAFLADGRGIQKVISGEEGRFAFLAIADTLLLEIEGEGYAAQSVSIVGNNRDTVDLEVIWLQPDEALSGGPDGIFLTTDALEQSPEFDRGVPLLQAGRDVFQNRAAFDFSVAFFRPRGFDSRESEVYLNGMSLNRMYDGRPSWASLGGLTDIGRNTDFVNGRGFSAMSFGAAGGTHVMRARPSSLRPGVRLTVSGSNRTYRYRQMATYNSGVGPKGFGLLVSLGNRFGKQGYIAGTPYKSFSGYLALEWVWQRRYRLLIAGLYNRGTRGQSRALTAELVELGGRRYNPNWGNFNGTFRSSRKKLASEPIFMTSFEWDSEKFRGSLTMGYQTGSRTRTRLAYYDASNPDPAYYRNLPSYYYNSPIGANYFNTALAENAFRAQPQIPWAALSAANRADPLSREASYLISGNEEVGSRWYVAARATLDLNTDLSVSGGISGVLETTSYSERILDLMGAEQHRDRDPFTDTRNDLLGPEFKNIGERIGYHYALKAYKWNGFLQMLWTPGAIRAGMALNYGILRCTREGKFRNERFPDISLGTSPEMRFPSWGLKAILQSRLGGRQWISGAFGYESRLPLLQSIFWDPREHNLAFPLEQPSTVYGGSLNLHLRHPGLKGRVSLFYTRYSGQRNLRSYFAETGFGSGFIREVMGGIGSIHQGLEAGLELSLNTELSVFFAAGLANYIYSGNPRLWISSYPGDTPLKGADAFGSLEVGEVALNGLHKAAGPQTALSIGLTYRDPGYWWMDIRANYMAQAYENLAILRHAPGFDRDPQTGMETPLARPETIRSLLRQEPLPSCYVLNASIGKSWLVGRHYISIFLAFNNLFDQYFVTGGYQQGRLSTLKGLLEDSRSGRPSFGSRYWQGYGRTYFLNITWSF